MLEIIHNLSLIKLYNVSKSIEVAKFPENSTNTKQQNRKTTNKHKYTNLRKFYKLKLVRKGISKNFLL